MRILHLSDIHVWSLLFNPVRLFSKRSLGVFELLRGRAKRFRLERLESVIEHASALKADHILITGDLTTTALPGEFRSAREALAPLLKDPHRATVLPGNHDRYTSGSVRYRAFEAAFGEFAPQAEYPWIRPIGESTAILGLDATRSHISAKGKIPADQMERANALMRGNETRPERLIVGCHYPIAAPEPYRRELEKKRMTNSDVVASWLSTIGPHLFCCGHVHAAWAFQPPQLANQLCLNSGAPILRDPTGRHLPGFLEITLEGSDVRVLHHAWRDDCWAAIPLCSALGFFRGEPAKTRDPIETDLVDPAD